MARTVTIRAGAATDLAVVVRSIARTISLAAAGRWRQRIESVIRSLADDADQWPEADEVAGLGLDLRCRLFGRPRQVYRVLFTIDGQTVNVHRVRHAAQDRLAPGDV